MSESIDNALNRLKDMLSTEEGQKALEGILGGAGEVPAEKNLPAQPSGADLFNADALMKMQDVMNTMRMDDDPRVRLLSALRPYISKNRGSHIDNAIKIMSLGKLPGLLKNMRK
jgi:hypothetical protein